MKILGSLNFYSKYIKNMSLDAKPFYDLIKEETKFVWTDEHSKLFQYFKDQADCELAIPNDKFPYFITVDASLTGVGATLAQTDENKKMRIISYNSRIFTKNGYYA